MINYLISIIVPVYNCEMYIEECILSIINQTYKNLEVLLIDDGSTDNSGSICDYYARIDSRIKVIHKRNEGVSKARNAGLKLCTGKYISFVDSDDIIQNNYISSLLKMVEYSNSEIALCKFECFSSKYSYDIFTMNNIKIISSYDFFKMILTFKEGIFAGGSIISSKLLSGFHFPENRYFEDFGSIFYLYSKVPIIPLTDSKLYKYRNNPKSIVNTINQKKVTDYIKSAKEFSHYISLKYKFKKITIDTYLYGIYINAFIMSKNSQYYHFAKDNYKKICTKNYQLKMKIKILLSKYFSNFFEFIVKIEKGGA